MTSVSSRESPLFPPESKAATESRATAPMPAAGSTGRAPAAPSGGNHVEAYSGPPGPPARPSPGAGTPTGQGALTAGQLALTGGRRPEPPRPEALYEELKASLGTSWKDWAITDADVRRVHERLEALAPDDYRKVLGRMDGDGLLTKYLEEAGPEARGEFLAQAERKGYVSRAPGKRASFALVQPPDGPALYRNDKALPGCMRQALHGANVAATRGYYAAHREYVHQYTERVLEAKSPLDIRQLGEPVAPFSTSEPGVDLSHPDYEELRASWTDAVRASDPRMGAYVAVSQRMADLSGLQRPGSFWFKAEAELSLELGPLAARVGGEAVLTSHGQLQGSAKGGAEASAHGYKLTSEADLSGAQKASLKPSPSDVPGVSADDNGGVRFELPAGPGLDAYSELNTRQGRFGGGVSVGRDLGENVKGKLGVGLGMQGARAERARDVASKEEGTLFGALPELEQRISWTRLDPARRERMMRDGWTAESWTAALQRPAPERR